MYRSGFRSHKKRKRFVQPPVCCPDRLCGLLVRVPAYSGRNPGFDSPALPDFLSSCGSGTGSTQPREHK
jgi:hypothetical protein